MSGDLSISDGNCDYASFSSSPSIGFQPERCIYQIKVILVGDSNVGKTSLLKQYSTNKFSPDYKASINAEFEKKNVSFNATVGAELTIWDTCGSEKYRSITKQYYKDSHGVLLLFDLTDRGSFDNLTDWVNDLKNNCDEYITIIIVGNKNDMEDKRQVSQNEIDDYVKKNNFEYFSVSAKTGASVGILFEKIAHMCVDKMIEYEKQEKEKENNKQEPETVMNDNNTKTTTTANTSNMKKMNISKKKEKVGGPFTGEVTFKEKLKEESKDKHVGCC
jgi:small GTP-binding protein